MACKLVEVSLLLMRDNIGNMIYPIIRIFDIVRRNSIDTPETSENTKNHDAIIRINNNLKIFKMGKPGIDIAK